MNFFYLIRDGPANHMSSDIVLLVVEGLIVFEVVLMMCDCVFVFCVCLCRYGGLRG